MRFSLRHLGGVVHCVAVACCLAVGHSAVSAATVRWNGADGTWDFAAGEWLNGASFVNGDTAVFNGIETPNRGRTNLITVDANGVSPAAVQSDGGFSATFNFTGGDILTGSVTTGTSNNLLFSRNGSYSFRGGLTSGSLITYQPALTTANQTLQLGTGTITTAGFYFFPAQAGTKLNNTINLTGSGSTNFWSSANADWSATTVNVTGANPINLGEATISGGTPMVYNNLTMTLLNNAQFKMNTRAQTGSVPPAFTGVVNGAHTLTTEVASGYQGYSIIGGNGNWGIAGLTKTGTGLLRLNAPEVVGDVLRINAGKVFVGTGRTQTVTELWLGGVQQTVQGTYGATGSGATFVNDTYFGTTTGFTGVIVVVPEPATLALAGLGLGLVSFALRRRIASASRRG